MNQSCQVQLYNLDTNKSISWVHVTHYSHCWFNVQKSEKRNNIHRRRQNTEWSYNIALRLIRRRAHSNQNWRFFPNYKAHNMSLTRTFFHAYSNTLFPIQCQHFPETSCTSCCCLKPRAIWILAGGVVTKLSLNLLRHLLKGMLFQRQC